MLLKSVIFFLILILALAESDENVDKIACNSNYINSLTNAQNAKNISLNLHSFDGKWSYIPIQKGQTCFTMNFYLQNGVLFVALASKKQNEYKNILFGEMKTRIYYGGMRIIQTKWRIYDYNKDQEVEQDQNISDISNENIYWIDWNNDKFTVGNYSKGKSIPIIDYNFSKESEITHIGLKIDENIVGIDIMNSDQKCPNYVEPKLNLNCKNLNISSTTSDLITKQRAILHEIKEDFKLYKSAGGKSQYTIKSMISNLMKNFKIAAKNDEEYISTSETLSNTKLMSDIYDEIETVYFNFINELGLKVDEFPDSSH